MKLSYPIAAPDSRAQVQAFCGLYEPAFPWLREHGYTGVELLVRDPAALSVELLDRLLAENGLRISAVGTSPMQVEDHLFLIHPEEENRREAMRRCRDLVQLASYYKAPALVGKYRGQLCDRPGCGTGDMDQKFREICEYGRNWNTTILLEPQNSTNINNLNTIGETVAWLERMGQPNLGILADIYHMGVTEASIEDSLRMAAGRIGLIHMADSGRMVPGLGELPIKSVLKTLEETAYHGFISMEIRQWPDSFKASALSALTMDYLARFN